MPTHRPTSKFVIAVLVAYFVVLLLTNPWFNVIEDEVKVLTFATQPAREVVVPYLAGRGIHQHPFLSDLFLHFWLPMTAGHLWLVRMPACLIYILGIWALARAAACISPSSNAERIVVWLAVLWPLGFHFGRLAIWYPFAFLFLSLLTWFHFRLRDSPSSANRLAFFLAGTALLYTNYLGWAFVVLLLFDTVLVSPDKAQAMRNSFGWIAAFALAFAPLLHESGRVVTDNTFAGVARSPLSRAAMFCFSFYTVLESEALAPWFLRMAIPALVAVGCVVAVLLCSPSGQGRRLFFYFTLVLVAMAAVDILVVNRLLMLGPWLLLPIALTAAGMDRRPLKLWLVAALVTIAATAWTGILNRRHYSALHLIEPWRLIAPETAARLRRGEQVIADNPSLMFYLAYELGTPPAASRVRVFAPFLPQDVNLTDPLAFLQSGVVQAAKVELIITPAQNVVSQQQWDQVSRILDSQCVLASDRKLLPDTGYALKARLFPKAGQVPWRIRLRDYSCPPHSN